MQAHDLQVRGPPGPAAGAGEPVVVEHDDAVGVGPRAELKKKATYLFTTQLWKTLVNSELWMKDKKLNSKLLKAKKALKLLRLRSYNITDFH